MAEDVFGCADFYDVCAAHGFLVEGSNLFRHIFCDCCGGKWGFAANNCRVGKGCNDFPKDGGLYGNQYKRLWPF